MLKIKCHYFFSLLALLFSFQALAQQRVNVFKLGILYDIGCHAHRLGMNLGLTHSNNFAQINAGANVFYAFKNYGPRYPRWETQTHAIVQLGFKDAEHIYDATALMSEQSNFMYKKYCLAYGVKLYSDRLGTSQWTGIIQVRANRFFISTENDGLVFLPFDKFRTAAFSLGYDILDYSQRNYLNFFRLSTQLQLYTGNPQDKEAKKISDSKYPARNGYIYLSNSRFGDCSHGILSLRVQSNLPFQQNINVAAGIDAEQIRNVVQNKFWHDLHILPAAWIKIKNYHIPMLQANGEAYLYEKNQKIRKAKLYFQSGINSPIFY